MINSNAVYKPTHEDVRPSSLDRTVACSVHLFHKEYAGLNQGSPEADEGTMVHFLVEHYTNTRTKPVLYTRFVSNDYNVIISKLYYNNIMTWLDLIEEYRVGYTIYSELEVPNYIGLDIGVQVAPGHADFVAISDNGKEVVVLDYKNGFVFVDITDNNQLLSYTYGVLRHYAPNAEKVTVGIVQPNIDNIIMKTFTTDEIKVKAKFVVDRIKQYTVKDVAVTGGHCTYCPIKNRCKSYSGTVFNNLKRIYILMGNQKSGKILSDNDIDFIISQGKEVDKFIKEVSKKEKSICEAHKAWLLTDMTTPEPNTRYQNKLHYVRSYALNTPESMAILRKHKLTVESPVKIDAIKKAFEDNKELLEEVTYEVPITKMTRRETIDDKNKMLDEIFDD